jgi:hypothetical protein
MDLNHIEFNSLQEIEEHVFFGCHAYDSAAFRAITKFARETEGPEAAAAIRIMGTKGMGLPEDPRSDEEIVAEFLADQE